ncbi:MAG: type II secretion system protein GspM [Spongiibacteraceae bacterium]
MNALKSFNFKPQWQQWEARFNALKPREQLLIMIAGVAIVLMLCDQLLWDPLTRSNKQQKTAIAESQQQLDQFKAAHAAINAKLAEDPNAELQRNLEAVIERVAKQNEQLAKLTVDLIPPEEMANVLHTMISKRGNLQLLALRNEPVEPAFTPKADTEADNTNTTDTTTSTQDNAERERVAIYRHGLTLELKGRYFDIVEYLQALENLQWHFYWEKLDYKVDKYPDAIVTLKVYTLSNRESWIGA